jgi:peptidoglycan/LPS O-acetylase OafA/YrhL
MPWVDAVKGIAIVWIIAGHVIEVIFGFPAFQNPGANWPPLSERIDQMMPTGRLVEDLSRYVGWTGDQGVNLFLVVTGLVLAYSLTQPDGSLRPLVASRWWPRRFARLMPMYWVSLVALLLPSWLLGNGASLYDGEFWLSLLGFRASPSTMYYAVPAFWYVGLLVQLYLVYPLIWAAARRWGVMRTVIVGTTLTVLVRLVGLLVFGQHLSSYLDLWSRGAVVVTRLPEVLLGMGAGVVLARGSRMDGRAAVLLGAAAWSIGFVCGFTLTGMAVNPLLSAAGGMLVLYGLFQARWTATLTRSSSPLAWAGRHSLSLFLVNQLPAQHLLFPSSQFTAPLLARIAGVLLATVIGALALEWVTQLAVTRWRSWRAGGPRRVFLKATVLVMAPLLSATALEAATRRYAPQEVFGGGERPSLTPSERFGWTRTPNSQARLRWLTYDYQAPADSAGFPPPFTSPTAPSDALRVLLLGDAFTSPEGVEPAEGWPVLMKSALAERLRRHVEILNTAATGYGPDQEARIAEAFVPSFAPDVVVVEAFVNDFEDVRLSDDDFRTLIGFGRPSGDSLQAWLHFSSLSSWARNKLMDQANGVLGRPGSGEFFAQLDILEQGAITAEDRSAVTARLARIVRVAKTVGARVEVVMVPSSVQVCPPQAFDYQLGDLDLADTSLWDVDGPQKAMADISRAVGVDRFTDLRPALKAAARCPYQPANMHWLPEGHALVAAEVTRLVAR